MPQLHGWIGMWQNKYYSAVKVATSIKITEVNIIERAT